MTNYQRPHILLIGSTGQVGFELCRTLAPLGRVFSTARQGGEMQLDLTNADNIQQVFTTIKPDLVVNAAAYTNVNQAETDQTLAQQINATAVGQIGELAKKAKAPVVHYSTDYVYLGNGTTAWLETDQTKPLNIYGKTKLLGEQYLIDSGAESIILRTSWVYGLRGQNFLLTMRNLFANKDQLSVVNNEIGAPTWSRMIAETTNAMLAQTLSKETGTFQFAEKVGIYNFTAEGEASWYDFACAIRDLSQAQCQINPILSKEYPAPAKRPLNSRLNNQKFKETFCLSLPDWRNSLVQCLGEVIV